MFYLPCVCIHTDAEGKQRKARVRHIIKFLEKNTIYNKHLTNIQTHIVEGFLRLGGERVEERDRCPGPRSGGWLRLGRIQEMQVVDYIDFC